MMICWNKKAFDCVSGLPTGAALCYWFIIRLGKLNWFTAFFLITFSNLET